MLDYRLVAWTSIVKNKMKPTNPNAHMNLPDTPDMTLLERHSWETLLGRPSWEDTFGMTLLGDTLGGTLLVRHSWHDTLVGPSWEDTLWKTLLTWHSWETLLAWHSWKDPLGKTLLGDTLGRHSWEDIPGRHSWGTILTWHFHFHHLSKNATSSTEFARFHQLTQPWQCDSHKSHISTRLKCCACHESLQLIFCKPFKSIATFSYEFSHEAQNWPRQNRRFVRGFRQFSALVQTCKEFARFHQLTQAWQCDSHKSHISTRLKCCACHAKWHRRCPKCCACHEKCNASFENVAKVLRLPHKTIFDMSWNMLECHATPATRNEATQRWKVPKVTPCAELPNPQEILLKVMKIHCNKQYESQKWLPRRARVTIFQVAIWQGRFQNTANTTQCRQSLEKMRFLRGRNYCSSLVLKASKRKVSQKK